jgi:hypothetical protein
MGMGGMGMGGMGMGGMGSMGSVSAPLVTTAHAPFSSSSQRLCALHRVLYAFSASSAAPFAEGLGQGAFGSAGAINGGTFGYGFEFGASGTTTGVGLGAKEKVKKGAKKAVSATVSVTIDMTSPLKDSLSGEDEDEDEDKVKDESNSQQDEGDDEPVQPCDWVLDGSGWTQDGKRRRRRGRGTNHVSLNAGGQRGAFNMEAAGRPEAGAQSYVQGMNVLAHTLLEVYGANGEEECYNFLRGIVEHVLPTVFLRDAFGRDTQLAETAAVFVSLLRQLGPSPAAAVDAMETIAGFPLELLTFKWLPTLFATVSFTSAGSSGSGDHFGAAGPSSPGGATSGDAASQQRVGLPLPALHACWDVCMLLGFPGVIVTAIALWKVCEEDVVAVLRQAGHAVAGARGGANASGDPTANENADEDADEDEDESEDEDAGEAGRDVFWWPVTTVYGDVEEDEEDAQEYWGAGLCTYALPEDSEDEDEDEEAQKRRATEKARKVGARARARSHGSSAPAPRSGEATLVQVQRAMDARLQSLTAPALLEAIHQVLLRCERLPTFRAMRWQHQQKVWGSALRSGRGEVWGTRVLQRMEAERRRREEELREEEQRRREAVEQERLEEEEHARLKEERKRTESMENVRYLEEQGRVFAARQLKKQREKEEKEAAGGDGHLGLGMTRSRAGSEAEAMDSGDEQWLEQQRLKEERLQSKRRSTSPADPSSPSSSAAGGGLTSGLSGGLTSGLSSGSMSGSSLLSGLSGIVSDVRGSAGEHLKGLQQELKGLSAEVTTSLGGSSGGASNSAALGDRKAASALSAREIPCLCINQPLPLRKRFDPGSELTGQVLEVGWAFVVIRRVAANSDEAKVEHEKGRQARAEQGVQPGIPRLAVKVKGTAAGGGGDGDIEDNSEDDGEGEVEARGSASLILDETEQERQEREEMEWAKVVLLIDCTINRLHH